MGIYREKYLSSDTLSKIARKQRFCRMHTSLKYSELFICKEVLAILFITNAKLISHR